MLLLTETHVLITENILLLTEMQILIPRSNKIIANINILYDPPPAAVIINTILGDGEVYRRKSEAIWIEKRNRWQIKVQNEGVRKTFVSSLPGRKGKIAAEKQADAWLAIGSDLVSSKTRVKDAFEDYIQRLQDMNTSKGHWGQYASIGNSWVIPLLGRKHVDQITEYHIESVLIQAFKAGLSDKYLRNIRACLCNFIKYCRKARLTTLRPEDVSVPTGARKSAKTTLQPEEIKVLFTSDKTIWRNQERVEPFIHAYRFCVLTGLRPGELIGLQHSDIDNGILRINRSINVYNEVTPGKNENAQRYRKLDAYSLKVLEDQAEFCQEQGIISPYIFPNPDGSHIKEDNLRSRLQRYCEHNDIGYRNGRWITPYELRHTFNSVNKNMPTGLKKIAMGHSETFDGDAIYSHQMAGDLEKIAAYTESAFKNIFMSD